MFDRGFVTYSNAAKVEMLGVSPQTLAADGAVSEEVAREMATGALAQSQASHSPSPSPASQAPAGPSIKPEGRVCFGLAQRGQPTRTETVEFGALGPRHGTPPRHDHALAFWHCALP